jgi:hypothetical protein
VFAPVEAAFDLVAAAIVDGVEGRRAPASAAAAFPVGDLVVRFGDRRADPLAAQGFAVRPWWRLRLVTGRGHWPDARPTERARPGDADLFEPPLAARSLPARCPLPAARRPLPAARR